MRTGLASTGRKSGGGEGGSHGSARRANSGLGVALLVGLLGGCGGGAATTTTTYTCAPACPTGSHCGESGCIVDDLGLHASPDLLPGGDGGPTCSPACSGATPYCMGTTCVPCLVDGNCPSGTVCRPSGNSTACVAGCSDDARCGGGTMKCCAGGCVDTASDGFNCGTCGKACAGINASASCVDGACAVGACDPGWGDCNHDATDGCEAFLRVDPKNCAACGATCAFKNAIAACSDQCYVAACQFGFDDCDGVPDNGCEVSVLSDAKNCGACGNSCMPPPHASTVCVNASCQINLCSQGYADCNGDARDGCEVNTFIDVQNCGVCGAACAQGLVCKNGGCTCPGCNFANASSKCVNNMCVIDKCLDGWGDCNMVEKDGCEQDLLYNAKNCGACGNECPMNTPYCTSGKCTNLNASVLILYADSNGFSTINDVKNTIVNTGAFTTVDTWDGKASTPTVDDMRPYGAVFVYSNDFWRDANAIGDNLADFFDQGGQVVVAVFAQCLDTQIKGRFGDFNNGYMLIESAFQEQPNDKLGNVAEPNSPLMKDVMSISASSAYRSPGAIAQGATVVASWGGGTAMIVRGSINGKNIVALNVFPPSSLMEFDFISGDIGPLFRNALLYR